MPQFRVVKDGRRTTGDRGDWGVVYTPLGIFLHNEVEEIPDPVPEPDSTGSTTPDPEPAPEPEPGVGFADPEPEPKPKKRLAKPSSEGSPK
jgi:hypothetical protein